MSSNPPAAVELTIESPPSSGAVSTGLPPSVQPGVGGLPISTSTTTTHPSIQIGSVRTSGGSHRSPSASPHTADAPANILLAPAGNGSTTPNGSAAFGVDAPTPTGNGSGSGTAGAAAQAMIMVGGKGSPRDKYAVAGTGKPRAQLTVGTRNSVSVAIGAPSPVMTGVSAAVTPHQTGPGGSSFHRLGDSPGLFPRAYSLHDGSTPGGTTVNGSPQTLPFAERVNGVPSALAPSPPVSHINAGPAAGGGGASNIERSIAGQFGMQSTGQVLYDRLVRVVNGQRDPFVAFAAHAGKSNNSGINNTAAARRTSKQTGNNVTRMDAAGKHRGMGNRADSHEKDGEKGGSNTPTAASEKEQTYNKYKLERELEAKRERNAPPITLASFNEQLKVRTHTTLCFDSIRVLPSSFPPLPV